MRHLEEASKPLKGKDEAVVKASQCVLAVCDLSSPSSHLEANSCSSFPEAGNLGIILLASPSPASPPTSA